MDQTETEAKGHLGLPLTFGGVAAYSRATPGQCALRCGIWAAVCAALWGWSIGSAWIPGVELALSKLPEKVAFRAGRLAWPTPHPILLANDRFLSLIVNPGAEPTVDRTSDIQVEFGVSELRCRSFLGWIRFPYPAALDGDFGRDSALPWWDAWKPSLLVALALILWLLLLISWTVIGSAYTMPALVIARILRKRATVSQVWRICVAAMLPAGAFVTVAAISYASNRIGLLLLCVFWAGHWVVGWIYLVGGIACFPKPPAGPSAVSGPNPFGADDDSSPGDRKNNPFQNAQKPEMDSR